MNRERLLLLRETVVWLRDTPELPDGCRFNMHHWKKDWPGCGSAMCLAGWYVHRNPGCGLVFAETVSSNLATEIAPADVTAVQAAGVSLDYLSDHFGIDYVSAVELFMASEYPDYDKTLPQDVARIKIATLAVARIDKVLGLAA